MISYLPSSSRFLSVDNRPVLRPFDVSVLNSSKPLLNFQCQRRRKICFFASTAERKPEASWLPLDETTTDDYGGWAIIETRIEKKKGLPKYLLVCFGTSVAILIAAIAHVSFTRKGYKFQFNRTLHAFQGMLMSSGRPVHERKSKESDVSDMDTMVLEASRDPFNRTSEVPASGSEKKLERVIIPFAEDSTQKEALLVLKRLKIMEDTAKADELCTRREYARWLIKANSLLERNPKHLIASSDLPSGSVVDAFDDVGVNDPDFWCIQALAESGIIPSKLSGKNSLCYDMKASKTKGNVDYFPESFISRLDLICWKSQLEYPFMPGTKEKISRMKLDFMDVKEITPDASPELFMDLLASEKSIWRKVFGQSKRLQPRTPTTKAQAAVAISSGRMTQAIHMELSRLEAENSSRLAEMEEIRSELLLKGEIEKFWDEKMKEEKSRGIEVERNLIAAVHDLEEEKIVQNKGLTKYLKEKAALDCQKQLLLSLEEEVNEMSERHTRDKANLMAEKQSLKEMLVGLQAKQESILDAKSILEAEKEAIQILRSWVEDEARKSQARAKVLEAVLRRWNWQKYA